MADADDASGLGEEDSDGGELPHPLYTEWLGPGIGVGAGGGTAMAFITGNLLWLPVGLVLGVLLGVAFGAVMGETDG